MNPDRSLASRFGYFPALDGLRAAAIFAVLIAHALIPFRIAKGVGTIGIGGFLGVDIFFVLSGFLITSLLLREWETTDGISFKKFYARRALRLLPALFALIIVATAYSVLFLPPSEYQTAWRDIFVITFYISNLVPISVYSLEHTWSLAVEEQFYLFYPIFLFLALLAARRFKVERKWVIVLLLMLIGSVAAYRGWEFYEVGFSRWLYVGSATRADSLLVGCVFAMLYGWGLLPQTRWFSRALQFVTLIITASIVYVLLMIKWDDAVLYYGGFTLLAFAVGIVIISLQISPVRPLKAILELPPVVWIGQISYGLYLWHRLAYIIVDSFLPSIPISSYTMRRMVVPFVFKVSLAIIFAAISYYGLEKPFLRWKERFSATGERRITQETDTSDDATPQKVVAPLATEALPESAT